MVGFEPQFATFEILFSWCPTKEIHPHHDSLKGPTDERLLVFHLGARLPAKMARPICETKLKQGKNTVDHVREKTTYAV